jgi:hypothetical protein
MKRLEVLGGSQAVLGQRRASQSRPRRGTGEGQRGAGGALPGGDRLVTDQPGHQSAPTLPFTIVRLGGAVSGFSLS